MPRWAPISAMAKGAAMHYSITSSACLMSWATTIPLLLST
jgi:hypothetical protein